LGFVQGEGRTQGSLFPVRLEELIPDDHVCRVIDGFVERLDMAELGLERAEAAETGRPGYDSRDLLKLYRYGVSAANPFFAEAGGGVPAQCRVAVAAGTADARSQDDCRVPADASGSGGGGGRGVDPVCAPGGVSTR